MALHFNKLDLCYFCRLILIFHKQYEQNTSKPRARISPRHPHLSNPQLLLIIENGINSSTPKQGYAIFFTTPLSHIHIHTVSISAYNPFKTPYLHAIHSKIPFNFITAVIIPWASSDTSLSHITYTLCGSLISHELHHIHSMRQPHIS